MLHRFYHLPSRNSKPTLSRRDSLGTWTNEILPVDGTAGSIAFNAAGNPYIAIVNSNPSPNDFHSITLLGTTLEPALLEGDANGDGVVSADDYASVQVHFGDTGVPGIPGDATGDGLVSADDYGSVQANFGATAGLGGVPIPEPATLSLLVIGGLAMLRRRRS